MNQMVALKCSGFTLIGLIMLASLTVGIGQEPKDPAFRGRLPAYYGDIVTEAQRRQIYAVQEKYDKQISSLKDQLEALENKRQAEIEAVLSAEQKAKLKKTKEDAATKKKKTAEKKAADAKQAAK